MILVESWRFIIIYSNLSDETVSYTSDFPPFGC